MLTFTLALGFNATNCMDPNSRNLDPALVIKIIEEKLETIKRKQRELQNQNQIQYINLTNPENSQIKLLMQQNPNNQIFKTLDELSALLKDFFGINHEPLRNEDSAKFYLYTLQRILDLLKQAKEEISSNIPNDEITFEQPEEENEQPTCTICFDEITFDETKTLSCKHVFHRNCINEWLKRNCRCPNCRKRHIETTEEEYPVENSTSSEDQEDRGFFGNIMGTFRQLFQRNTEADIRVVINQRDREQRELEQAIRNSLQDNQPQTRTQRPRNTSTGENLAQEIRNIVNDYEINPNNILDLAKEVINILSKLQKLNINIQVPNKSYIHNLKGALASRTRAAKKLPEAISFLKKVLERYRNRL